MDYLINNIDSLHRLRREKRLKHRVRKIRLDIDDDIKFLAYERKLNKYYFDSGHQELALGVYFALCCWFSLWLTIGFSVLEHWRETGILIILSSFAGKICGLLVSRYKLRKLYQILEDNFVDNPVA